MRTIQRDIASALIFSRDQKLFLGRKDPAGGGVYAACWHIPGGGIDSGESLDAAVRREVLEETGIQLSKEPVVLVSDEGRGTTEKRLKETDEVVLCEMRFFVYRIDLAVEAQDVHVALSSDLVEYQWFSKAELSSVELTPPSVELFTRLGYLQSP